MIRSKNLADELYNTVFGDPWHGASMQKILENITAEQAVKHPITGAHSIIEILLHMWAWTEEVNSRLSGGIPNEPAMGDWPRLTDFQKLSWAELKNQFFRESQNIINTIKNFPEERLDEVVGLERNSPLGTGVSFASMILGLIQHNAYHSAQISLLKKIT
jgi:uncharacterized damage-inducible protein DinB